ncbi:hypothetical protein FE257_008237 [Aspergillus nanangensis]|uniref:Uncharacterized protein n=1 Tax=Aspergillus nanangensis TaxID=2582783 RepID=A0AAD4GUW8_ASPNN|nr:hypothetical protein FE257_008237 [Aspergillus nanangensis]
MEFIPDYHLPTQPTTAETRYRLCQDFFDHQIPHAIWFEDALVHYGVPNVVFDLYILVEDIDRAANLLTQAGWTLDMKKPPRIGNAEVDLVDFPQRRLMSPDGQTITVLLPAAGWKFHLTSETRLIYAPLENKSTHGVPFPPLAGLLDALIESWLDCPSDDAMLLIVLACQISYLYAHVPGLKQRSFADQMKYEHRQFHFDVVAGMETGTLPFRRHQRVIRDALLQGEYELRECSASRDDKDLFFPLGGSDLKRS